jgi:hypothetical protein
LNEEQLLELFREATCSDEASQLDDVSVDAFLAFSAECSPERAHRIGSLFVKKLFEEIHKEPVRTLSAKWPFHSWLESMRTSVRLTRDDIASALNQDHEFIERLENGEKLPWELQAKDIGDVVCLFRIHMNAVLELIGNSVSLAGFRGLGAVSARSHKGRMSRARGDSTKKALDLYLARNATPIKPDLHVERWLGELRRELEHRRAIELL